ncbi:hypothetical protein QNI16_12405 [Cytophagaceae bacterium YF14B1]|uniref:Uncharacterized protein n=1 Tax=Xanthocytophaga flava TaxID=3048013 RepID=A0AAE3QLT7_9BACT|nr:hypothetical protein [Xanthocytophaga flavus]MDJ1481290.1 hypothetical protein [Xanthocytophaga flavus]
MNTFPDLKRLLRKAGVVYQIIEDNPGRHNLLIQFKPDKALLPNPLSFPVTVVITGDNYCLFQSQFKNIGEYDPKRKKQYSVEVYCFDCEELLRKMHRFGFLPNNAKKKIDAVAEKEGYGYTRKSSQKKTDKSK